MALTTFFHAILLKIKVDIAEQSLMVLQDGEPVPIRRYPVSTAENGPGEAAGSLRTPRGRHVVRAKIGAGQPINTVFSGRRPSGEVFTAELGRSHPERDWILTRILWLSGCEPGFNRLGDVDTMRRYIYIHGTADEDAVGRPASHGCIRMRNRDVAELFDLIPPGTPVEIVEREDAKERGGEPDPRHLQ